MAEEIQKQDSHNSMEGVPRQDIPVSFGVEDVRGLAQASLN